MNHIVALHRILKRNGILLYKFDGAKHLTKEFGGGFTATNLKYMRLFYKRFLIRHSLRDELTWTHYRTLLKVQNDDALAYYISECASENWSVRQL